MLRHQVTLVTLCIAFSTYFSCGNDKKKKNRDGDKHAQEEDSLQLTDTPILNMNSFTNLPEGMLKLKRDDLIEAISTEFNLQNPLTQSQPNARSLNFKIEDAIKHGMRQVTSFKVPVKRTTASGCQLINKWTLQDEVKYVPENETILLKRRVKEFCSTGKDRVYTYYDDHYTYHCEGDSFAGLKATNAKEYNEEVDSLCPNGVMTITPQNKVTLKITDEDGGKTTGFQYSGLVDPSGYCDILKLADGKFSTSCTMLSKTIYKIQKAGETETKTYVTENRKIVWQNLIFSQDYKFYESGFYDFIANDWVGNVSFEETGMKPQVQIMNQLDQDQAFQFSLK